VTPTPTYLYYMFAMAMLAVAAYSLALLVVSIAFRRPSGWDVDIAHLAMGLSMAGMFITDWAFGPNAMWQLIFMLLLAWFVVRSIQAMQLFGIHLSHYLIHAAMSFAMLLMYWFPAQSGHGTSASMSMGTAAGGARIEPGLSFLLAFLFFASAVFTLASPTTERTIAGMHCMGRPRWRSDLRTSPHPSPVRPRRSPRHGWRMPAMSSCASGWASCSS